MRFSKNIGFLDLLTLMFVGLKLTGHITWSWIWVLSPTWLPIVVAYLVVTVLLLIINRTK